MDIDKYNLVNEILFNKLGSPDLVSKIMVDCYKKLPEDLNNEIKDLKFNSICLAKQIWEKYHNIGKCLFYMEKEDTASCIMAKYILHPELKLYCKYDRSHQKNFRPTFNVDINDPYLYLDVYISIKDDNKLASVGFNSKSQYLLNTI